MVRRTRDLASGPTTNRPSQRDRDVGGRRGRRPDPWLRESSPRPVPRLDPVRRTIGPLRRATVSSARRGTAPVGVRRETGPRARGRSARADHRSEERGRARILPRDRFRRPRALDEEISGRRQGFQASGDSQAPSGRILAPRRTVRHGELASLERRGRLAPGGRHRRAVAPARQRSPWTAWVCNGNFT